MWISSFTADVAPDARHHGSWRPGPARVRLAEIMAAVCLATDLGIGQPLEQVLCVCELATC